MYYQMLPRMSLETGEQISSQAVSAEDQSVLIGGLTIYNIGGTSPDVTVTVETSDDGEVWANVATIVTGTAVGFTLGSLVITTNEWGRLVRVKALVGGANSVAEFAVGLHTHISS